MSTHRVIFVVRRGENFGFATDPSEARGTQGDPAGNERARHRTVKGNRPRVACPAPPIPLVVRPNPEGRIAQLVRAPASHAGGPLFESACDHSSAPFVAWLWRTSRRSKARLRRRPWAKVESGLAWAFDVRLLDFRLDVKRHETATKSRWDAAQPPGTREACMMGRTFATTYGHSTSFAQSDRRQRLLADFQPREDSMLRFCRERGGG